jgi:hypothetical protein
MRNQAVVRTYITFDRPRSQAELDWFRQQPSLRAAIERAAMAINSKGQRHGHHRRRKKATLEQACQILMSNENAIGNMDSFDELISFITEKIDPLPDLGELYCYDTALGIGAYLNLLPEKIYLHSGTRRGAKNLGRNFRARALEIDELPPEFKELQPNEMEDILCIYKDEFLKPEDEIPTSKFVKQRRGCYDTKDRKAKPC